MTAETFFLTASDGEKIAVHRWAPDKPVRAVLQISHGMAEFAMRYDQFAREAAAQGIEVFAADHRGHGETAGTLNRLGYLADKNGFDRVMLDQKELTDEIRRRLHGTPVFLFAHSFGSFIGQYYIENHGNLLSGCVLCGTRGPDPVMTILGKFAADCVCAANGRKKPSPLLTQLSFGTYNAKIDAPSSPNAWLSRDEKEVEKYDASPWTGFTCTAGFFQDLTSGLLKIHKQANLDRIPRDLPVFLIAGDHDPVGGYGKTVEKLCSMYRNRGIAAEIKLYPGARHELLNETCRDEVSSDIRGWIDQILSSTAAPAGSR